MDVDVVKTKTQRQGGITVYIEKEDAYTHFEEEEYYMDLDFLESDETT